MRFEHVMAPPNARPPPSSRRGSGEPARTSIPSRLPADAPLHRHVLRGIERLVYGLIVHNAGDAAPAMAFHFFLSLVPLLVLVGLVIGQFARQGGVDALLGPAIETAPDAVEQIVRKELERMAGGANATSVAPLSVLGFLWLAATGTHGLMDAFEVAAGAPRRVWWKKRVIALVWVTGTLGALGIIAWATIGIDSALQRSVAADRDHDRTTTSQAAASASQASPHATAPRHPTAASGAQTATKSEHDTDASVPLVRRARRKLAPLLADAWERVAIVLVLALASLCALATFYRFAVKHPPGVDRRAWPGAIVAFTSWLLVSWGFGLYVPTLGRYALFYGSVATVAVLLVWFYLSSWALLIGAELNAQLEGLRDK
jgi:uncharacterized BrkB/YihY/UPF0761 family membrane protein